MLATNLSAPHEGRFDVARVQPARTLTAKPSAHREAYVDVSAWTLATRPASTCLPWMLTASPQH
jgi:hypothetical protein